ncbi:hypothetical protein ABTY61_37970 [Kitasatospora sp. NPDC096128]|uniref:hypothetical protein n=1 Tax=Kitasatospora sp. NPDC096128 TaxID=3155547 RepID=UPI0033316FF1
MWPVNEAVLAPEREQWAIFARWNQRYEAGGAALDTHPGHGGVDARYDELTARLAPHREAPADARRLGAELRLTDDPRYRIDGVDYLLRWSPRG